METVFVTGGSGFLGKALIKKLIERGDRIKVLLRPTSQFEINYSLKKLLAIKILQSAKK